MAPIPAIAHFIWLGTDLQWVHLLALRSAALRGGFERVVLHHDRDLSHLPCWRELSSTARIESRRLDTAGLFARCGGYEHVLNQLYERLHKPEAKANVLRAALLHAEGGVYLDTDTVTIADLTPLRLRGGVLCGQERVVKPANWDRDRSLRSRLAVQARARLRDLLKTLPQGFRAFRRVEWLYPLAANNAVLACEPRHPFITSLLVRMAAVSPERQAVRFALGTHLLQEAVSEYKGADLNVVGPEVFYPLGPEISLHWFRRTRRPDLASVLHRETRVVHWYASVRTRGIAQRIDAAYIRRNASSQLFSQLALPFVNQG